MVEKVGTIRNPLTIIAIFAAVSEISGTVVLPFVAPTNQAIYVWFLIIFPALLVALFFATLNFNHRVLYAPSDYKNEDNFVRSLQRASYAEKALQVEAELAETIEVGTAQPQVAGPDGPTPLAPASDGNRGAEIYQRSLQGKYAIAEELVFRKLSREFTAEIQREVRFRGPNSGYIFDGVVREKGVTTVVEVKLIRRGFRLARLSETFQRIHLAAAGLTDDQRASFRLLLALVFDGENTNGDLVVDKVTQEKANAPFPIEVRVYVLSELEREFSPSSPNYS